MLDRESEKHTDAREVYLSRFPDAAPLFEFSDFNIFVIEPVSARVIAGFGQAVTITGEDFVTALSGVKRKIDLKTLGLESTMNSRGRPKRAVKERQAVPKPSRFQSMAGISRNDFRRASP